jgi:hypothetical protein
MSYRHVGAATEGRPDMAKIAAPPYHIQSLLFQGGASEYSGEGNERRRQ